MVYKTKYSKTSKLFPVSKRHMLKKPLKTHHSRVNRTVNGWGKTANTTSSQFPCSNIHNLYSIRTHLMQPLLFSCCILGRYSRYLKGIAWYRDVPPLYLGRAHPVIFTTVFRAVAPTYKVVLLVPQSPGVSSPQKAPNHHGDRSPVLTSLGGFSSHFFRPFQLPPHFTDLCQLPSHFTFLLTAH